MAARLLVAVGLLSATSQAAVRTVDPDSGLPARWSRPSLALTFGLEDLPHGLDPAAVRAAAREAGQAWRVEPSCRAPSVEISTTPSRLASERDGRSTISFRETWWCKGGVRKRGNCYDPNEIAVTNLYFDETPGETAARIVEVDIELNAVHYGWSTNPRPGDSPGRIDLASALAHEIGHALGFAHPCGPKLVPGADERAFADCVDESDDPASSVMGPLELGSSTELRRKLSAHDVEALCAVYGAVRSPAAEPRGSGRAQSMNFGLGFVVAGVLAGAVLLRKLIAWGAVARSRRQ